MAKRIKEFFKRYPTDVRFSRDIEDVKKHIEFKNEVTHKRPSYRTKLDLRYVLGVLITIFIVAPTAFLIGLNYPKNNHIPSVDPSGEFTMLGYMDQNYDKYIQSAVETLVYSNDLEISLYIGLRDEKYYLIVHAQSNEVYEIALKGDEKTYIHTQLMPIRTYEIAVNSIQFDIYQSEKLVKTLSTTIDLGIFIGFLKDK